MSSTNVTRRATGPTWTLFQPASGARATLRRSTSGSATACVPHVGLLAGRSQSVGKAGARVLSAAAAQGPCQLLQPPVRVGVAADAELGSSLGRRDSCDPAKAWSGVVSLGTCPVRVVLWFRSGRRNVSGGFRIGLQGWLAIREASVAVGIGRQCYVADWDRGHIDVTGATGRAA